MGVSAGRARVRVLIADVMPAVGDRTATLGWQLANDGDSPIVARGISAPDRDFYAPERPLALEVPAGESRRIEIEIEMTPLAPGSELRDRHLVIRFDDPDGAWRAVASLDAHFGPGGVVLPRTTALTVDPDQQRSGAEG